MEAGVVDVALTVWHPAQDIRKTHVPQNLVRGIGVTGMEGLGNSLVDPSQRNYEYSFRRSKGFWRGSIEGLCSSIGCIAVQRVRIRILAAHQFEIVDGA